MSMTALRIGEIERTNGVYAVVIHRIRNCSYLEIDDPQFRAEVFLDADRLGFDRNEFYHFVCVQVYASDTSNQTDENLADLMSRIGMPLSELRNFEEYLGNRVEFLVELLESIS